MYVCMCSGSTTSGVKVFANDSNFLKFLYFFFLKFDKAKAQCVYINCMSTNIHTSMTATYI